MLTLALCLVSDSKHNSIPDHLWPLKCYLLTDSQTACVLAQDYAILYLGKISCFGPLIHPRPHAFNTSWSSYSDLVLQCANTWLHEHLSDTLTAIPVYTLFSSNAKYCMRKIKVAITSIKHLDNNGQKPQLASLIPECLWGERHERGPAITCLQLWDSSQ